MLIDTVCGEADLTMELPKGGTFKGIPSCRIPENLNVKEIATRHGWCTGIKGCESCRKKKTAITVT